MPAHIARRCRTGPLSPIPVIVFSVAVGTDIGTGTTQNRRLIVASRHIVFTVPAAVSSHGYMHNQDEPSIMAKPFLAAPYLRNYSPSTREKPLIKTSARAKILPACIPPIQGLNFIFLPETRQVIKHLEKQRAQQNQQHFS